MENRRSLLAAAVSLTLFFTLLSCLAAALPAASRNAAFPANAIQPVQESAVTEREETGYLIRAVGNEVCVFRGDTLILRTGVIASLLPRQDREALEQGITVESRAELTALLEDLGS